MGHAVAALKPAAVQAVPSALPDASLGAPSFKELVRSAVRLFLKRLVEPPHVGTGRRLARGHVEPRTIRLICVLQLHSSPFKRGRPPE